MVQTWVATWFSPEKDPVRALLVTIMLGSLVVSAAIPEAFDILAGPVIVDSA